MQMHTTLHPKRLQRAWGIQPLNQVYVHQPFQLPRAGAGLGHPARFCAKWTVDHSSSHLPQLPLRLVQPQPYPYTSLLSPEPLHCSASRFIYLFSTQEPCSAHLSMPGRPP